MEEKIPAGTTRDKLCSTSDIVPTVANLIGADLPDHKIDGKDIRPLKFTEQDVASPQDYFYCYDKGGELQAIRNQRFKLVFPHKYRTLDGKPGGSGGQPVRCQQAEIGLSLFDLSNDLSETKDVQQEHPEIVRELNPAAEVARDDLGDTLTKRQGMGIRPAGKMTPDDERLRLDW